MNTRTPHTDLTSPSALEHLFGPTQSNYIATGLEHLFGKSITLFSVEDYKGFEIAVFKVRLSGKIRWFASVNGNASFSAVCFFARGLDLNLIATGGDFSGTVDKIKTAIRQIDTTGPMVNYETVKRGYKTLAFYGIEPK